MNYVPTKAEFRFRYTFFVLCKDIAFFLKMISFDIKKLLLLSRKAVFLNLFKSKTANIIKNV